MHSFVLHILTLLWKAAQQEWVAAWHERLFCFVTIVPVFFSSHITFPPPRQYMKNHYDKVAHGHTAHYDNKNSVVEG